MLDQAELNRIASEAADQADEFYFAERRRAGGNAQQRAADCVVSFATSRLTQAGQNPSLYSIRACWEETLMFGDWIMRVSITPKDAVSALGDEA